MQKSAPGETAPRSHHFSHSPRANVFLSMSIDPEGSMDGDMGGASRGGSRTWSGRGCLRAMVKCDFLQRCSHCTSIVIEMSFHTLKKQFMFNHTTLFTTNCLDSALCDFSGSIFAACVNRNSKFASGGLTFPVPRRMYLCIRHWILCHLL